MRLPVEILTETRKPLHKLKAGFTSGFRAHDAQAACSRAFYGAFYQGFFQGFYKSFHRNR